jgi:hypothetical protein
MLPGITYVVIVSMLDVSPRTTARPSSVRRHVDRRILRFSLSIGVASALFIGVVYIASAFPNVRRSDQNNSRALSEINCAGETCNTKRFAMDWQSDQPDYVIDKTTLYLIAFPTSTEEDAEHFAPLDYFDTGFIEKFRQPASYNTPDGEVGRLYSREAKVGDTNVEICIGYAIRAPWKILETPPALLGTVDATLKREADDLARSSTIPKSVPTGSRPGLSSDGFVIVDANTKHIRVAGPWLPAFLPGDANLPTAAYQLYVRNNNLYLLETDAQGRILAASLVSIGSLWWLAALCGVVFLCMSLLARALLISA